MSKGKKKTPPKRGMNALDRIAARLEAKYEDRQRFQTDFLLQAGGDAFILAAADVFDMGPDKAGEAMNAYREYVMRLMDALIEDGKDDDELTYFWADLDRRLEQIVGGENFSPHEARYDETGIRVFAELFYRTAARIRAGKEPEQASPPAGEG